MLEDKIGYIRITKFIGTDRAGGTEEEFNKALAAHKQAGMQALILDLRSNQGGLLDAAYHIADAFISEGVIVSTRGGKVNLMRNIPLTPTFCVTLKFLLLCSLMSIAQVHPKS